MEIEELPAWAGRIRRDEPESVPATGPTATERVTAIGLAPTELDAHDPVAPVDGPHGVDAMDQTAHGAATLTDTVPAPPHDPGQTDEAPVANGVADQTALAEPTADVAPTEVEHHDGPEIVDEAIADGLIHDAHLDDAEYHDDDAHLDDGQLDEATADADADAEYPDSEDHDDGQLDDATADADADAEYYDDHYLDDEPGIIDEDTIEEPIDDEEQLDDEPTIETLELERRPHETAVANVSTEHELVDGIDADESEMTLLRDEADEWPAHDDPDLTTTASIPDDDHGSDTAPAWAPREQHAPAQAGASGRRRARSRRRAMVGVLLLVLVSVGGGVLSALFYTQL